MVQRLLSFLCGTILVDRLAALAHPCIVKWQTTDDTGAYWTDASGDGVPCSPLAPNICNGGPNAQCVFSPRTFSYRCCHDVFLAVGGLDLADREGWLKPQCPYGSESYADGAHALTCSNNERCPTGYTCTKSINQPPSPSTTAAAAVPPSPCKCRTPPCKCGAFLSPNVCCLASSVSGRIAKTFADLGISPTIVPVAPVGLVQELNFKGPPIIIVHQGADMSLQRALFIAANSPDGTSTAVNSINANNPPGPGTQGEIFLPGAPISDNDVASSTTKFHVLIFDATTNKDILLFNYNLPNTNAKAAGARRDADASNDEKLAVPPRIKITPTSSSISVIPVAGVGTFFPAGYKGPADYTPLYTSKHLFVMLVFKGTVALPTSFVTATGPLGPTAGGGTFTTVTAFLNSDDGKQLGSPIAGTYFYI